MYLAGRVEAADDRTEERIGDDFRLRQTLKHRLIKENILLLSINIQVYNMYIYKL